MAERIPLLSPEASLTLAHELGLDVSKAGRAWFRTLGHNAQILKGVCAIIDALFGKGQIDTRSRELILLRVGWLTRSDYQWAQHWRIGSAAKIPEADMIAVRDWPVSHLAERDRAILAAVDDSLAHGKISDEAWTACARHFDRAALVELVIAIANAVLFSQLLGSLGVPRAVENLPLWPPDGLAPTQQSSTAARHADSGGAERMPLYPLEKSIPLGRSLGIDEARSSRGWFRSLAYNSQVLKGLCALTNSLLLKNTLPTRLRELLIMRIAWLTGADYEWAQHWRIGRQAGVPDADLLAARDPATAPQLDALDRAVIAAVDDTLRDGRISDSVWAECAAHLDASTLIEMVVAIGHWTMFSQFLRSLNTPLEEGLVSWAPDGKAPPGHGNAAGRR